MFAGLCGEDHQDQSESQQRQRLWVYAGRWCRQKAASGGGKSWTW